MDEVYIIYNDDHKVMFCLRFLFMYYQIQQISKIEIYSKKSLGKNFYDAV